MVSRGCGKRLLPIYKSTHKLSIWPAGTALRDGTNTWISWRCGIWAVQYGIWKSHHVLLICQDKEACLVVISLSRDDGAVQREVDLEEGPQGG